MTQSEVKSKSIDALIAQAEQAQERDKIFTAQRHAIEAMRLAHQHRDYARMGCAVSLVRATRRAKFKQANAVRKIVRLSSYQELDPYLSGETPIEPGWYLFEPMLVAADGRDFRERADADEISVLVVVREPETQLGLWPVAMVGPQTVRVMLQPPKRMSSIWMKQASAAMGEEAIARIKPGAEPCDRLDRLMALIETVIEDDELHAELERACHCAANTALASASQCSAEKSSASSSSDG